jgi:hypothetical protein
MGDGDYRVTGPGDDFRVEVTGAVQDEGSVLILEGRDVDTGDVVRFVAERRPALRILEAVEAGEEPVASVPPWAVWGRVRPGRAGPMRWPL